MSQNTHISFCLKNTAQILYLSNSKIIVVRGFEPHSLTFPFPPIIVYDLPLHLQDEVYDKELGWFLGTQDPVQCSI